MDIRDIETFLAVAHAGSLTGAALVRCRTTSALSKALRRLEDEFGTELFDRSGSRLRLNSAGRQFTPHAEQILGLVQRAKLSVRPVARQPATAE